MKKTNTLLPKTDPRFLFSFVKPLTVVTAPWSYYVPRVLGEGIVYEGKRYTYDYRTTEDCKVGDTVLLAKRIPTQRGYPQQWAIYVVRLPENYWWYETNTTQNRPHTPVPVIHLRNRVLLFA